MRNITLLWEKEGLRPSKRFPILPMARRSVSCLSSVFCLALLLAVSPVFGQSLGALETMQPPLAGDGPALSADDGRRIIHVTDRLARMPESIAALRAYHEARVLGLLPAAKAAASYDIGDEKEFNVLKNLISDNVRWETRTFTLAAESDIANIWVANDQQGVATDEQLAEINSYVISKTPEGSWRPEQGIIANSHEIFGDPPKAPDADGKVDILFFDIEEGNDDECCILGFVTVLDLNPDPDAGRGNAANILYMDLPDGIQWGVPGLSGTLTHEYQHLIHYAYQRQELTFVNEGLSEWSELLHGFPPRNIRYMSDPNEHGVRLLSWRRGGTTQQVGNDYQRSGLFTTYIADRIGRESAGSIVRAKCPAGATFCPIGSSLKGAAGYEVVLGEHNLSLAGIVADFHAANFINDASVGAKYAYQVPVRQDIKAVSTVSVDAAWDISPFERTVNVSSGAVEYLTWEDVTNLSLKIRDFGSTDGGGPGEGMPGEGGPGSARIGTVEGASSRRDNLSLRLFTKTKTGAKQVIDLDSATQDHVATGEYEQVTLIVINAQAVESSDAPSIKLDITGSWGNSSEFDVTTVSYERGQNEDHIYLAGDEEDVVAQIFPVPAGARLSNVFVAPVYDNQFTNRTAPAGAPRDFTLKVWDVQYRQVVYEEDDTTDPPTPLRSWRLPFPGRELYSQDMDESAGASHINFQGAGEPSAYSFLRVNLPLDEQALSALPDSIFIGLANKGVDNNYLVSTTARSVPGHAQDTLAYWYGTIENEDGDEVTGWRPMASLRLCRKEDRNCDTNDDEDGWFSLAGQVFPMRARFRTPLVTSAEDPLELPSGVTLAQNYPNPFNPATSITWTQPASAPVRLSVYNLLGQKVAMPVDGLRPAGEHEVRLDASGWASGVYVYTLETGAHIATRRMVLLK